ncbi:hypothetical protein DQ04_00751020 [Trypanosoma grayi]|uniref:hypothetical protein n=1 Tax=Trypanosoma grayi TaxID=71804 RepID=UPI0004F4540F|nr:hypothetical protein DQ04_00751020 [Trypanosoma grayi]KEG13842.1 hypothetical protein DQ04_00751020 [Trypanosoma grayi]
MVSVNRHPAGVYCGEYSLGLVKGRITAGQTPDTFDIWLDAFGEKYNCKDEKYIYNERTNHMDVVGATDPNDCLGKLLVQNGLPLTVVYFPREDTLELDLGIAKVDLSQCA